MGMGRAGPHSGMEARTGGQGCGRPPASTGPQLGGGAGSWAGCPHPGQQHISDLLYEVAAVLPLLHQAIEEQGCGEW